METNEELTQALVELHNSQVELINTTKALVLATKYFCLLILSRDNKSSKESIIDLVNNVKRIIDGTFIIFF